MTSGSSCRTPNCKNLKPVAEHDFETVDSETVYIGQILALRADKVRMPGGKIATREVIEHYGAVGVVALDDQDNVAMVYQYRHAIGRRLWELPAGLLDLGGEPPHVTAARELEEEAGLAASDWHVLADLVSTPGFTDESVRVYLATGVRDVGRPDAHDEEADLTMKWIPLDQAVQMVFSGEIVNSLAVVGILAAHGVEDRSSLRPVDAPWADRPHAFAERQAKKK
jgi:ADP-ribose pyrophosphatase